jgi:dienelactone hydrolase
MIERMIFCLCLLVFTGCGEENDADTNLGVVDASQTTEQDGSMATDSMVARPDGTMDMAMEADSQAGDATVDATMALPQPEPTNTLEAVQIETWMRGMPPSGNDPLYEIYERGRVQYPEENSAGDENNVRWFTSAADEDGTLSAFGITQGYAVTRIDSMPHERFVIRADRASQIWTPLNVQPGDFYGSGRSLAPLVHQGDHLVVAVLASARRGPPRLQVFKTTDEVTFNLDDTTWPHLLVGQDESLPLGVPILNLLPKTLTQVTARVLENEYVNASAGSVPGLPPGSASQVAFQIVPKAAWIEAEREIPVTIRIESPDLTYGYERIITLNTMEPTEPHRRSFVSPVDGSVQYYGVRPPSMFQPDRDYGLVLSLHGAGVEAINQARAYSARHWTYVIAPTNRRPFGFDWEEWGRLNALASLDHATESYRIDPSLVHLTGHSMGGHGTWHVGVTTPGRFGVLAPSAGWESFYSYGGAQRPTGAIGRARAHSDTLNYLSNIARRGVYILHGDADDNVPIREGRAMFDAASDHTLDIEMHEEPGASHWWDGDAADGADCVDWNPLFQFMKRRRLDPWETDFHFRSPSPSYSAKHSFVTIRSAETPSQDVEVHSERAGSVVTLETSNVRSLAINAAPLILAGVTDMVVNDQEIQLNDMEMIIGPAEGKRPGQYGPFNEAFRRPFCFVYTSDDSQDARTAGFLATYWSLIGNGHSCGLTVAALPEGGIEGRNLIRLGATAESIRPEGFAWDDGGILLGEEHFPNAALLFVQPEGNGLSAGMVGSPGAEHLLRRAVPFSSRSGLPDYIIFGDNGSHALGFFDALWRYDPSLGQP